MHVRYVTGNQGKRLRPAFAILSAHAQADVIDPSVEPDVLKVATLIEMVHLATLVHDDILDGARLRRGQLTAAVKWGPEVSVLLGDCLLAQASVLAGSFSSPHVCRRVAEATAVICSGEILQSQRRFDLKLSAKDYLRMIEMKTGMLFAVVCELGAHLAGARNGSENRFQEFGRLFGVAYQIYDDCLDLVGSEKHTGKSLGTDLQKGKLTLPEILLLQQSGENEVPLISSMLLNEHANSQTMLIDAIRHHDTLRQATHQAVEFLQEARQQLRPLPATRGRFAMEDIAACLEMELGRLH